MQRVPAPSRNEEIAWAAGLFEGEGCFSAYAYRNAIPRIRASLGSVDRDVLERFERIVGMGKIYDRHVRRPNEQPFFEWAVFEAQKVRELADLLSPWLCTRRRAKAAEVIAFGSGIKPHFRHVTQCPKGHEYTDENTLLERRRTASGREFMARRCRACRRKQERERARRVKGITPDRFRVP